MSKHTPGPWHVRVFDGSQWSIDAEGDLTLAQACQIRPLPLDRKQEERTANARLIASAPELLEACKMIVEYDEDVEESGGEFLRLYIKALNAARAAIAKATGEPA
jgi:hypothetical protein